MDVVNRVVLISCAMTLLLVIGTARQAQAQCLACPHGGSCVYYCDDLRRQQEQLSRRNVPQNASRPYGAIALSPNTKKWGRSFGWETQAKAESVAKNYCENRAVGPIATLK